MSQERINLFPRRKSALAVLGTSDSSNFEVSDSVKELIPTPIEENDGEDVVQVGASSANEAKEFGVESANRGARPEDYAFDDVVASIENTEADEETAASLSPSEYGPSDEEFDLKDSTNADLTIYKPVKLRQPVLASVENFEAALEYLRREHNDMTHEPRSVSLLQSLQDLEAKLAEIFQELLSRNQKLEEATKAAQGNYKKLSQKALALELGTNKLQYSIDVLKEKLVETDEASKAFNSKLEAVKSAYRI